MGNIIMNKLTLLMLLGATDAHGCPFRNALGYPEGSHQFFPQSLDCKIPDEEKLENHEIWRQLLGETYKRSVRGMYHQVYDPISDQCYGEWTKPIF